MRTDTQHMGYAAYEEGVDFSLEGMKIYGHHQSYQNIRKEMGGFLLDLQSCQSAASEEKQVHYLFLALRHLDNLEREIIMLVENDEIIRLEMVLEKIRSLKTMLTEYICYLTKE